MAISQREEISLRLIECRNLIQDKEVSYTDNIHKDLRELEQEGAHALWTSVEIDMPPMIFSLLAKGEALKFRLSIILYGSDHMPRDVLIVAHEDMSLLFDLGVELHKLLHE